MINNTINDDKTIADGKAAILAGRYHILRSGRAGAPRPPSGMGDSNV